MFRTLTLTLAVLLSQTAHAAKPVRQLTPGTAPSFLKLCSAWPESRKDFGGDLKKVQRPNPKTAQSTFFSTASFLAVGVASFEASQQTAIDQRLQRLSISAPQSRTFVLRV
jgi:hypothetical protein